jgi:hypothetical protein
VGRREGERGGEREKERRTAQKDCHTKTNLEEKQTFTQELLWVEWWTEQEALIRELVWEGSRMDIFWMVE